jgi:ribosomal protein S24E|tara:strand:+ start:1649 stop:2089 length:441 start_codon:yes stop_codon:yes gene_type:complete
MKTKVLQETENKLFLRKEINLEIDHKNAQTPSRAELYKFMSVKFKAPAEQIVMKKMKTGFGSNKSLLKVYIYDNAEVISKIENKHFTARREKAFEAEKKAAEEAEAKNAEEATAEAPAEEVQAEESTTEEVAEAETEETKEEESAE